MFHKDIGGLRERQGRPLHDGVLQQIFSAGLKVFLSQLNYLLFGLAIQACVLANLEKREKETVGDVRGGFALGRGQHQTAPEFEIGSSKVQSVSDTGVVEDIV